MKFEELNLTEKLLQGIEDAGFVNCTAVQELAFAESLGGRDVAVQSQTGTGKTAAFLITIYQLFCEDWIPYSKKALVVVPTRELAVQIEKEARILGRHLPYTVGSIFGGVGYAEQEELLERDTDIIIGTPGRLLDFVSSGKLALRKRGFLVIDEADRLFDMGFLPDLRRMLRSMPPPDRRMTMLFSATLDAAARELAWEHMNDPVEIVATPDRLLVEDVVQELYHVGAHEKMNLLLGILKRDNPRNVLIFTNTKHEAYEVSKRLEHNGYRSTYMIGDLPQSKRLRIIANLKSGKARYLVATDVAARGLHVDGLEMVINYDIPQDFENYVHRIGRTARAGRKGKAVSLACDRYVYGLEAIERYIGTKIPVVWPEADLLEPDTSSGMRFRMTDREREPKLKSRRDGGERTPRRRKKASRETPREGREQPETATPETGPSPKTRRSKQRPRKTEDREKRTERSPGREQTREERLAYYRSKYGEQFSFESEKRPSSQEDRPAAEPEPPSGGQNREQRATNGGTLLKTIRRLFGESRKK